MPEDDKGILKPRAYARLLTMIGDQLIKNEKIALMELIKNAYDADANWVQIRFNNFEIDSDEDTLIKSSISSIEIEDDGTGMSFDVIKNVWLNPATPNKFIQKQNGENITSGKNRIIQGEKGIGRFAVYKLGTTIEITTRSENSNEKEIIVINDLSSFDDEIISDDDTSDNPKFLDQIEYLYEKRTEPQEIIEREILIQNTKVKRAPQGTLIRITNLRGEWSQSKIDGILYDISRLSKTQSQNLQSPFLCDILVNGKTQFNVDKDSKAELDILQAKAPVKISNGQYSGNTIEFNLNGQNVAFSLERLLENKEFRYRFILSSEKRVLKRQPECGPFSFEFNVFDFGSSVPPKYKLLTDEKAIIRANRIYLYRDNIRVFPYGNVDDDWLGIDILRGIGRAGDYLSNDQTVGFVGITTEDNPYLKDKTNREGLIEIGNAFEDFKAVLQGILGLALTEFKKYKLAIEAKNKITLIKESVTQNQFDSFRTYLSEKKDTQGSKAFEIIYKNYNNEKKYLKERAEITEDLAAVGIAVEAASHDLMMMMSRAINTVGLLAQMTTSTSFDVSTLSENIKKLSGQLSFIESQIEGIQPIFRSSKRRSTDIKIIDVINDVKRYYENVIEDNGILITVEELGKGFTVTTTESVLLQAFINLIDNATYWLTTLDIPNKEIKILIDKGQKLVTFSDNGPGINDDNQQFIFEPFFSTKGPNGRGLGLYIARQLLQRYDFDINYIANPNDKILPGSNFLLDFNP